MDTEIIIKPVRAFRCPLPMSVPSTPWFVVLCECFLPSGEPAPDNTRRVAAEVFENGQHHHPWFGMEQEYVLMKDGRPIGWPDKGYPAAQGPYYCGNGSQVAFGRKYVDRHFELGLAMGLKISGTNAEVMPGQWEFQVGPCEGLEMGDQLIAARWLYLRILEEDEIDIAYNAKPILGDWNGSGLHTNFSTEATRSDGGINSIMEYIQRLGEHPRREIAVYGRDNHIRLTGRHETSSINDFTFGVGTRGTSIRIPNAVKNDGRGYFEDRRPAANGDPYLISARLFATATGTPCPKLDACSLLSPR
jgi:glutamine synthetase